MTVTDDNQNTCAYAEQQEERGNVHDLQRIKQDLHEGLSLDKHPVALLLGAGCPVSIRIPNGAGSTDPLIPDIAGLTDFVQKELQSDAGFVGLLKQFSDDKRTGFTIEDLLSHLRLLRRIVGFGEARGLNATQLEKLEELICDKVAVAVRKDLPSTNSPYHDLAEWIGGVHRSTAVQLFTTNYDLLMEQALEDKALPFFDGFVGSRNPFFDIRAIEDDPLPPRWTRLWKLHGCVSWRLMPTGVVVRDHKTKKPGDGLLIHPSELKYDQSRRMPYLAMIDRLRDFMRKPSAFLVTIGYAFSDDHLNEVILQGLRSNPMAAGFGLLYKNLPEEKGAAALDGRLPTNLTLVSRNEGIVRGIRAPWLPDTSSGVTSPTASDLGDFSKLALFLRQLRHVRRGGPSA